MCKIGSSDELVYAQQIVDWGPPEDCPPPWKRHIGRCLEVFEHSTEAQVTHACIAMEPLAWDLYKLSTSSIYPWDMPLKLCKNVVRQLLVTLDGIHRDMGVILVGASPRDGQRNGHPDSVCNADLKPNNILVRPQEVLPIILDELISEPFEARIENPERYPVGLVRYDSLPLPPTRGASEYNLADPLEIVIVDFGRGKV
jgi:serine/threonine protein kinase